MARAPPGADREPLPSTGLLHGYIGHHLQWVRNVLVSRRWDASALICRSARREYSAPGHSLLCHQGTEPLLDLSMILRLVTIRVGCLLSPPYTDGVQPPQPAPTCIAMVTTPPGPSPPPRTTSGYQGHPFIHDQSTGSRLFNSQDSNSTSATPNNRACVEVARLPSRVTPLQIKWPKEDPP